MDTKDDSYVARKLTEVYILRGKVLEVLQNDVILHALYRILGFHPYGGGREGDVAVAVGGLSQDSKDHTLVNC